jgi:hypothetical protein
MRSSMDRSLPPDGRWRSKMASTAAINFQRGSGHLRNSALEDRFKGFFGRRCHMSLIYRATVALPCMVVTLYLTHPPKRFSSKMSGACGNMPAFLFPQAGTTSLFSMHASDTAFDRSVVSASVKSACLCRSRSMTSFFAWPSFCWNGTIWRTGLAARSWRRQRSG